MFKKLLLIVITSMALLTSLAHADDNDVARALVKAGKILSLEEILKNLRTIAQGNVIEVELEHKKQRLVYEIELVDKQGVVTEYLFDAKTAKLIKQKKED